MKICAFISLSGGQGKTTTAFFTSLLLAGQGKRVLVIDADPQANLTFYLGRGERLFLGEMKDPKCDKMALCLTLSK